MTVGAEPPFSAAAKLTPLEAALVRAVEAGETFRPAPEDLHDDYVRGELVRAMLLGSPLRRHPARRLGTAACAVEVTAHGIRIVPEAGVPGAPAAPPLLGIAGQLDLRGVAAPEGGFLPPLEFNRCRFDRPVKLDGARLQSLTLRASRFSLLSAKSARFNGDVTLVECRPRSDPRDPGERVFACYDVAALETDPAWPSHDPYGAFRPSWRRPPDDSEPCPCPLCDPQGTGEAGNCSLCCVLDLNSVGIDGGLGIWRSYLRAPKVVGRTYSTPPVRDELAIELRGIQVRDSVKIIHTTTIGRVGVASAEVDDDFWVCGGKFFSSAERPTFDFQLARIEGLLAFRAQRAAPKDKKLGIRAYPVVVIGHISAIGLRAGEVWVSEGFYFGHDTDKRGSFPTLNFAKSDIRGTFKVGTYHDYQVLDPARPTAAAKVHGDICLVAANIGKNFELLGLGYAQMREVLGANQGFFDHFGIDRGETPYLKLTAQGLKVDRRAYIAHASFRDADVPSARNDPSRPKESAPAAVDFWKSTIGTGFRIDHHSSCIGALRLNSCVIGREVVVGCETIEPSDADFAAADFKPGDIPLLLDISESTIDGHLRIGRHEPRTKWHEDAIEVAGGVSLQSTNVQGGILLGHLTFELRAYAAVREEQAAGSSSGGRVALDLRDCTCGSDLEIHSLCWKLPRLPPAKREAIVGKPGGLRACIPERHKPRFEHIDRGAWAEIDLRGLQCGMLIDGFGDEWGLVHRLRIRLAGMRLGEVEPASHDPPHAGRKPHRREGLPRRPRLPHLARLRWLAFQNRVQEVLDQPRSPRHQAADRKGATRQKWRLIEWWERAWDRFWRRHYCSLDDDFVPQAYDAFSSAYRRSGEDATAEAILVEKKNIQNALRFQRIREKWRTGVWGTRERLPSEAASSAALPAPGRSGLASFILRSWRTPWPYLLGIGLAVWVITVELKIHPPSSAMAIVGIVLLILLWPYLVAAFQLIFRAGFRYGLSPSAALFVFFIFIGVGWVGVHVARNGGLPVMPFPDPAATEELDRHVALVLDVEYQPAADPPAAAPAAPLPPDPPRDEDRPAADRQKAGPTAAKAEPVPADQGRPMRQTGHALHARASPCNLDVNSLLYAIDIFLPLIDLDQERRCTIREAREVKIAGEEQHDDYAGWRLAKALYEILGWIITSLVILTITGVLRRDLEP
jgi:hypothetical protein